MTSRMIVTFRVTQDFKFTLGIKVYEIGQHM